MDTGHACTSQAIKPTRGPALPKRSDYNPWIWDDPDPECKSRCHGRNGHCKENRIGQAWSQEKKIVCVIDKNRKDYGLEIKIPIGHLKCRDGGIVRIDKRGFAYCISCGAVYNDKGDDKPQMSKTQKKKQMNRFKYLLLQIDSTR
jgi:hypothetical protein